MTRKRFSEEDILGILRQIELELSAGGTVETAVRQFRVDDLAIVGSTLDQFCRHSDIPLLSFLPYRLSPYRFDDIHWWSWFCSSSR